MNTAHLSSSENSENMDPNKKVRTSTMTARDTQVDDSQPSSKEGAPRKKARPTQKQPTVVVDPSNLTEQSENIPIEYLKNHQNKLKIYNNNPKQYAKARNEMIREFFKPVLNTESKTVLFRGTPPVKILIQCL